MDSICSAAYTNTNSITYDTITSKYMIKYDNKTIVTTLTDKSSVTEAWIQETMSLYANIPLTVVGLDSEWKPNPIRHLSNKSATLQLCISERCLILQLFYMDSIPQSLKDFLRNPRFTFVGVEVEDDIAKLNVEYGLKFSKSADIQALAMRRYPFRFWRKPGLKKLALDVAGLYMEKPRDVCLSNWEQRVLTESQVEYACIDAYASYKIGHKLLIENER